VKPKYYTVEHMIEMIDEPNGSACTHILADNRKLFQMVQGSANNHQNWPGGYFDHVQEIMNIAIVLYGQLNVIRPLPFSLSDLLLVVYLHDIEKPWKYQYDLQKEDHQRFRTAKLAQYGIVLTPEQKNGMKYVEGESSDYTNRRRVMGPLACVAHMCDICSARLWFDHPFEDGDPWPGAKRVYTGGVA
jgi:hypothetical protein